jgi:myo-inositol-1(or 4)-monophosphatase
MNNEFLDVAVEAALEAGTILKQYWGRLEHITEKRFPGDLVTEADKASEARILEILQDRVPEHPILSEETGMHENSAQEYLWAIDPIDGTTNYAHQFPVCCVSIGLLRRGSPLLGVVYNPILNEFFHAVKGQGAFLNHVPLSVSRNETLNKCLLATGFAYQRRETPDNNYKEFCHMTNITQGVRRLGAAAIDLAYVAAGRLDGYWEQGLKIWDLAAGVLLVEEAGGKVSDYDGKALDLESGRVLASNGKIHSAMSHELGLVPGMTI